MFPLAITLGLYSYSIFFLGILHLLTKTNIILITIPFAFWLFNKLKNYLGQLGKLGQLEIKDRILLILIIVQLSVNLIGALGPEIGFDALWYHLTLPKIWLQRQAMIFIPSAQFKYSVMPMLTEMFYFIFPGKLIHYLFGILTLIVTYKISRSMLAVVILSSNLVFGWQSTSAYIDLARTFFEIMALYMFTRNKIYKSAIMLGLAASTKLLAFESLPIFWLLIWIKTKSLKYIIHYSLFMLLVISPWLLRSYITTGNPVYPFFTPLYTDTQISLDPHNLLKLLTHAADPIHPIYLLTLLLIPFLKIKNYKLKIITVYSLLSLILWILTPNTGGGRFILPYLPALSVVSASVVSKTNILTLFIILYSLFSVSYRFAANLKYLQLKEEILKQELAFDFGDYYDFDHFFKPSHKVLPIGINNLYYIDARIALPNEQFDYILVRGNLPPEYQNWKLVSTNGITKSAIYERPL